MEAATVQATPAKRRSRGLSERRLAAAMVSPSMILIAIVAAYPILYAIWLSLPEYSVRVAGLQRWAGPFGLPNDTVWLGEEPQALIVMIVADVWKTAPFMALLLLAGLQVISGEIYEAAK